jgi:hypothetical protein
MSNKHTQILKGNAGKVIRQWRLPKFEREMKRLQKMKVAEEEVYELCVECGSIKLIYKYCSPCRRRECFKAREQMKAQKKNKKSKSRYFSRGSKAC